jgi:Flp pilus assembly protein TadG
MSTKCWLAVRAGSHIVSRKLAVRLQKRKAHARLRRGAAVVEFAIVAPVFLALVFGIIEVGRVVMVQQVLTNGSRQGARTAILEGSTVADVETAVTDFLTNSSISGATVAVNPNPLSGAQAGDSITVTVSVPFNQVSWTQAPWFLGGINLSASTLMRREGIP